MADPILYEGEWWLTAEHAYQAAKTLDLIQKQKILQCSSAGKAKRLGKNVLLRSDWEKIKLGVMREILKSKFKPGSALCSMLISTRPHILVEGNHWGDKYWGVYRGQGLNRLGHLLMEIRDSL